MYEWVRNITFYLIFMTVAGNLLPDKKYEKYFRLFAGMVLILLVLKPFTGGLRLDDKLAYYFEAITFKTEASELTKELSEMEEKRLVSMINQYEEAVENDLAQMAESSGFDCKKAEAVIEKDEDSEKFGRVISIGLLLSFRDGGKREAGTANPVREAERVNPVAPVEVELDSAPVKVELDSATEAAVRSPEENVKLSGLRRRISEYYDLEERDIEIQLENGER